jgi:uncharacterized membrane protein
MTDRRTLGNIIAPPHFILFGIVGLIVTAATWSAFDEFHRAVMIGFDVAASLFLGSVWPLLKTREGASIRAHARDNDANRAVLLAITFIVMAVLFAAVATESLRHSPEPFTKILVIVTLTLAWLFSNTVYAFHYAHLAYSDGAECKGLSFPGTTEPLYWDFLYFAFTVGMTFQTSDVTVTDAHVRRVVTLHSLAAFAFNIGVLAFTINVLGSN